MIKSGNYLSLNTDLSLRLADIRAKKTSREVTRADIESKNAEISRLVPKLIDNKTFDELYLWDTNLNGKPRLIPKQIDGSLEIVSPSLYERFLQKAN